MSMDGDKVMGIFFASIILIVVVLVGGIGLTFMFGEIVVVEEYTEIYSLEAPFGILYRDSHGSFLYMRTDVSEDYTIKYFSNGKLKTIFLDAEYTDVVVDGTCRLIQYGKRLGIITMRDRGNWDIHIPYLPEVGNLPTEDYTILP